MRARLATGRASGAPAIAVLLLATLALAVAAQLGDPQGPDDRDQQRSSGGGQKERDAERHVSRCSEVADLDALGVLEDEDEQQDQDDGRGD